MSARIPMSFRALYFCPRPVVVEHRRDGLFAPHGSVVLRVGARPVGYLVAQGPSGVTPLAVERLLLQRLSVPGGWDADGREVAP